MNFVGMGLGKTAACYSVLEELIHSGQSGGALVIAPMRVANLTWPMERETWEQFSRLKVANLREPEGQRAFLDASAHVYLINYEAIPFLHQLCKLRKKRLPFDTLILDEITKCKNPSAKRPNLLRTEILEEMDVPRRWGLTGSPVPNSLLDLFAPMRLIDGGERLGKRYMEYRKTFFEPTDYQGRKWKALNGSANTIEGRISDITLTLRSSEWLKIPDMVIDDIELPLPHALQKQYDDFEDELVLELDTANITAVNAAALITKLCQFTSGAIYDAEKIVHPVHTLKLDALAKLDRSLKQPLLVACMYKHEESRIRERFPHARFFADAEDAAAQKQMVAAWNRRDIKMLVGHPGSVSLGLNLQHGSNCMVWFTLTYNREYYDQMLARLQRTGQTEIVQAYRLLVPETVDYALATSLAEKTETEDRLLSALSMLQAYRRHSEEFI